MTLYRDLLRQSWLIKLDLVLLFALLVALSLLLWPHWQNNPDLSHGLFMPALFLILLRESRQQTTPRYSPSNPFILVLLAGLLLAGLVALAASGLYSASVGWDHSLVAFTLTGAGCLFFFAGLVVLSNHHVRLLPVNWTSLVAIGLWLLCAPIPPGTYSKLTLHLQLMVSQHVLSTLHFLGIPASRHGNIIELATTSVGVAEACSGVRSLISCVFAGIFFSATLVHQTWARVFIIVIAGPIALVMNFIRSLVLTLLANRGVDIAGTWHDLTGFAVLGVTALILGALAILLDQTTGGPTLAESAEEAPKKGGIQPVILHGGLICASVLVLFFFVKTRPVDASTSPPPNLLNILPAENSGWRVETTDDLYQFSGILKTSNLAQRTYRKRTDGKDVQLTVYLAFWEAGQSSVSQVALHTPDACWPGSGWAPAPIQRPRATLSLADTTLPDAEFRKFFNGSYPQYVWFWHIYDGRPIAYEDPYSATELLRLAWRHGFRRQGDQLFVRVSSNLPWEELENEPLLAEIFRKLKPLGL